MIAAYHQLWQVEKSFRMSKHDLQARPIYHRQRDSIEAHLNIVRVRGAGRVPLDREPHRSIKRFVRTARRYRTIEIRAGEQNITAADPLPADLHDALTAIQQAANAH